MGGVMNYLVHLKACARLLAFSVSTGNLSELEEILLYMICFEEVCHLGPPIEYAQTNRPRLILP